jgi:hypothetical protein
LRLLPQDIGLQGLAKVMRGLACNLEFAGQRQTRLAFEDAADQKHNFGGP